LYEGNVKWDNESKRMSSVMSQALMEPYYSIVFSGVRKDMSSPRISRKYDSVCFDTDDIYKSLLSTGKIDRVNTILCKYVNANFNLKAPSKDTNSLFLHDIVGSSYSYSLYDSRSDFGGKKFLLEDEKKWYSAYKFWNSAERSLTLFDAGKLSTIMMSFTQVVVRMPMIVGKNGMAYYITMMVAANKANKKVRYVPSCYGHESYGFFIFEENEGEVCSTSKEMFPLLCFVYYYWYLGIFNRHDIFTDLDGESNVLWEFNKMAKAHDLGFKPYWSLDQVQLKIFNKVIVTESTKLQSNKKLKEKKNRYAMKKVRDEYAKGIMNQVKKYNTIRFEGVKGNPIGLYSIE
jgi:hypothetical protein